MEQPESERIVTVDTQSRGGLVDLNIEDGVAVLTLNRREKLNALTESMLADVVRHLRGIEANEAVLGAVLTGAGNAFTSGQDLDTTPQSRADMDRVIERFNDITRTILKSSKPVIAAINGIAVGGGLEITLSCDLRIAAEGAEAFFPENLRGLAISNGSSYLLPRLVGSHAFALVMDSRRIDAGEALRIGLFDAVVPHEELLDVARNTIRRWGEDATATAQHLRLMRPPSEQVEAAMKRELDGARELADRGQVRRGAHEYLGGSR